MKIHHLKSLPVSWVPLTDEVKALPLSAGHVYLYTDGKISFGTLIFNDDPNLHAQALREVNTYFKLHNAKPTHISVLSLPKPHDILPDNISKFLVITEEQEAFRAKFDKPLGSFIEHEGHTLVVEEERDVNLCRGCFFDNEKPKKGRPRFCSRSFCFAWARTDETNVIFREVNTLNFGPLEKGGAE